MALSCTAMLTLFVLTAESLRCAWNAGQLQFAADAGAQAGLNELSRSGARDEAVLAAVQRNAGRHDLGPASGAQVSATILPGRRSVAVTITKPGPLCLMARLGFAGDKRTARAIASLERQPARPSTSPHSICFNLFPC